MANPSDVLKAVNVVGAIVRRFERCVPRVTMLMEEAAMARSINALQVGLVLVLLLLATHHVARADYAACTNACSAQEATCERGCAPVPCPKGQLCANPCIGGCRSGGNACKARCR